MEKPQAQQKSQKVANQAKMVRRNKKISKAQKLTNSKTHPESTPLNTLNASSPT
jgi:hypothetical protein